MSIFLADLKRFLIMLKLPARISRLSRREKEDAATKRVKLWHSRVSKTCLRESSIYMI